MSLSSLNQAREQLLTIKQAYFESLVSFFEQKQEELSKMSDSKEKEALQLFLENVRTEYKKVAMDQETLFKQIITPKLAENGK